MSSLIGLAGKNGIHARLRVSELLWKMPDYRPLGGGVGEIRFDRNKVEHRLYGYFGPGPRDFTVLIAASGKGRQQELIKAAKTARKQIGNNIPLTETYDV